MNTGTKDKDGACVDQLVSGQAGVAPVELAPVGSATRRNGITAYHFQAPKKNGFWIFGLAR